MYSKLKTPITQDTFDLDPEFQAALRLTDEVNWSLAIMTGRYGSKQVPLACDADGGLTVAATNAALTEFLSQLSETTTPDGPFYETNLSAPAYLKGIDAVLDAIDARLISTGDECNLADYFDSAVGVAPFYSTMADTPIVDIMDDILTILYDVYDYDNHALTTKDCV